MISILTPTYNRGYLLSNLYNSLKKQTVKSFEWIIIDDGSNDNTGELVEEWKNNKEEFSISYFKMENGGKHRAINLGIDKVKYNYTFIVDSDDYILEDTIEKVIKWIGTIDDKKHFAGVAGLKGFSKENKVGDYPLNKKYKLYIDANNLERKKYNLLGDKAEIYRTELLKKYKFPEFEDEKFVTEAAVWNRIAKDGYKIRWYNDVIYICDYMEDGLTNMGIQKEVNNFKGFTYFIKLRMETEDRFLNLAPLCSFCNVARKKGLSIKEMSKIIEINIIKIWFINIIDIFYRKIHSFIK